MLGKNPYLAAEYDFHVKQIAYDLRVRQWADALRSAKRMLQHPEYEAYMRMTGRAGPWEHIFEHPVVALAREEARSVVGWQAALERCWTHPDHESLVQLAIHHAPVGAQAAIGSQREEIRRVLGHPAQAVREWGLACLATAQAAPDTGIVSSAVLTLAAALPSPEASQAREHDSSPPPLQDQPSVLWRWLRMVRQVLRSQQQNIERPRHEGASGSGPRQANQTGDARPRR